MKSKSVMVLACAVVCMVWLAAGRLNAADKQPAAGNSGQDIPTVVSQDTGTLNGTPKISVPDSVFNFGTVSQQRSLTHVFKIFNVGDAPLKLINASAS